MRSTNHRSFAYTKRFIDIVTSSAGLVVLLIPLLLIALAIKLDSPGPVFYRQKRAGKSGKPFEMVKFRTMMPNAEHLGLGFEVAKDDSRVTSVGKLLRDWGMDEYPQLFNILKGEMSLVGPRAARMDQIEHFTTEEQGRMRIKPGLTGWAQVNGRNSISWKRRIELDLWYVENESLWLDLKILLRTVWVVLIARTGRYGPEGITRDYRPE